MSSVSSINPGRANSNNTPVDQSLLKALHDFQEILDPGQKQRFLSQSSVPDASAAIILTAEIDNENAKRRSRCVAARILSFLESVQQFCSVVDTFVSSNPRIAALVWGSVKFVMLAASNFASYFDKLSSLLMNLRNHFPRYSKYRALYSQSTRVQGALCEYHAIVVTFCKKVLEVGERSGFLHAATSFLKPFETEFGEVQTNLTKQNFEIEKELDLAEREAAAQERQFQEIERRSAQSSRCIGSLFRKKMELESEGAHYWRKQVALHKSRKKRQILIEKLSSYEFKRAYSQACRRRHGATGSWIQRMAELEKWLRSTESSVFWCFGIPGSGKTVLTAGMIGELFRRIPAGISGVRFFFCEYDRPESLKAVTILSSLIKQSLDVDNMSEKVEKILETATQDPSDPKVLEDLLLEVFGESAQQCIVLDAIDECDKEEQRILLAALRRIMESQHAKPKVFLASGLHIGVELERFLKIDHHFSMTSSKVDLDIRVYIESILAEKITSGELVVGEPHLVDDVQDALLKGAKGMFLWVFFQIQDLCSHKCDEDIRRMIDDLPSGLYETYERALRRINSEEGTSKWAQKIFRWVAAARQPLALEELREAIAIKPGQTCRNPAALVNDINQLIPCCRNLVILDEEENVVQFAHHTIKRFLLESSREASLGNFHFQLSQANYEIGEVCVTYLNFTDFKQVVKRPATQSPCIDFSAMLRVALSGALGIPMTSRWLSWLQWAQTSDREADITRRLLPSADPNMIPQTEQLNSVYALLPYASKHWLLHSSDFTKAETGTWRLWNNLLDIEDSFSQLPWTQSDLLLDGRKFIGWIVEHEHSALLERNLGFPPICSEGVKEILQNSVEAGSFKLVQFLTNSEKAHISISDLWSALPNAARTGNLAIIDMLLARLFTFDPYRLPDSAHTSLAVAAGIGNLDVVKRLLEAGIHANVKEGSHMNQNALVIAVQAGHYDMVDLLLGESANITGCGSGYMQELSKLFLMNLMGIASGLGHLEILNKLLKMRVHDKEIRPSHSVLVKAVQGGDIRIVDTLLKAGADVNASPVHIGHAALLAAVAQERLEIVDRLLEVGVKTSGQHGGNIALRHAAKSGNLGIVESLIKAGVDVNDGPLGFYGTLMGAAQNGHVEIVQRILKETVYIRTTPGGKTALELAATTGNIKVVEILLEIGADVNHDAVGGYPALLGAVEHGHTEIVRRLVKEGLDVNHSYDGRTALQVAGENGDPIMASILRV